MEKRRSMKCSENLNSLMKSGHSLSFNDSDEVEVFDTHRYNENKSPVLSDLPHPFQKSKAVSIKDSEIQIIREESDSNKSSIKYFGKAKMSKPEIYEFDMEEIGPQGENVHPLCFKESC